MKLNAIIVDDERKSRENLEMLLASFVPEINVVGVADGVATGIRIINQHKPDVAFLDIHLAHGDGFEILNHINKESIQVIFVTGHEEHAVQAFREEALDYLLKPVDISLLQKAASKALKRKTEKHMSENEQSNLGTDSQITLSTSKGFRFLKTKDIVYCKGDGAYTYFFLTDGERITTSKNLGVFEEMLPSNEFFRSHKSYIINLTQMTDYNRSINGFIKMSNGDKVSISKRKKDEFLKIFTRA